MSCLPCSVVGTSSARRFAPVARSFRVLWLCEWRRTPRASASVVERLPRLRWPATDGLGQTRLGTVYSAPASNRPAKTSVAGASAPPPTAGGVKVLFSCHAPHVAVNLKEGRAKEAQEAQPAAHGTVAVLAQGSRISVKPKTLPNSGRKILACTSPARAVERARLGPSGSLPRDQGAPLRRRGHFSRLAPA